MAQSLDSAAAAFSVFANSAEPLSQRRSAAKNLGLTLAAWPASKVQGPIRTALIKCALTANFCQSHSEVDDRFCEVSALLRGILTQRSIPVSSNYDRAGGSC